MMNAAPLPSVKLDNKKHASIAKLGLLPQKNFEEGNGTIYRSMRLRRTKLKSRTISSLRIDLLVHFDRVFSCIKIRFALPLKLLEKCKFHTLVASFKVQRKKIQ